jgi:hypothetical protein
MCEPATCGRLRVMPTPAVSCDVLLELQALLHTVRDPVRGGVLQAQHRSLLDAGGADATVSEATAILSTHALPLCSANIRRSRQYGTWSERGRHRRNPYPAIIYRYG